VSNNIGFCLINHYTNYILFSHCVVDAFPLPSATQQEEWYSVPMSPKKLEIIIGTNVRSVSHPSNRLKVKRVLVHDKYSHLQQNRNQYISLDRDRIRNDIALLEIDGEIKFNNYVKAIKIAPEGFAPAGKQHIRLKA